MKKYIKPFIQLTEIDNEAILAGSPGISQYPAGGDACAKGNFDDDWGNAYVNAKANADEEEECWDRL